jgi:hypothetical protein
MAVAIKEKARDVLFWIAFAVAIGVIAIILNVSNVENCSARTSLQDVNTNLVI